MKIYFDGTLIDSDYYTELSKNQTIFNKDEVFSIGNTIGTSITLGIDKTQVSSIPSVVEIDEGTEITGTYIVDSYEENDTSYIFQLADKMINFNFRYDAEEIIKNSPHIEPNGTKYVTLKELLQDMCDKADVTLATSTFLGENKHVSWYDNTITAREYLGMIAELNCGYAIINKQGELELRKWLNTSLKNINFDDCEDYNIGEYHKITRVVCDNAIGSFDPVGDETYNTLYLNPNNVYITEQQDIQNIYDIVKNYEYYSFSTKQCPIDIDIETGDCIEFTDGTNTYKTYAQLDLKYLGDWVGGYSFIVGSGKKEETEFINGTQDNYKRVRTLIDRANNRIDLLAEKTTIVSDTMSGIGTLTLQNASEGMLYYLSIKGQISLLYPANITGLYGNPVIISDDLIINNNLYVSSDIPYNYEILYPSDNLFSKSSKLKVDDIEYKLDFDFLNYINDEICDEFIYENGTQKIIRRVGIDEDGNKYPLPNEVIELKQDLKIEVKSNSTLTLLSFPNAKLYCRYLLENDYTNIFANKIETQAQISLTDNKIEQTVSAVVDGDTGRITPASIVLAINNDESTANISADKIGLSGESINLTSKNLSINSDNFNVDNNGYISLKSTDSLASFVEYNNLDNNAYIELLGGKIIKFMNGGVQQIFLSSLTSSPQIILQNRNNTNNKATLGSDFISITDGSSTSVITPTSVTPGSMENSKKNFEDYQDALNEIMKTDIYKYNYKSEEDNSKKHVGFVIGENRNYSKDITTVMNDEEIGADLYSMISVLWQGVKEQQEIINKLQEKIDNLEEIIINDKINKGSDK